MASDAASDSGQELPAGTGVLKRLLRARMQAAEGAGRPPQLPQTLPVTPARAAATAIGRAADRLYGLGVRPVDIRPGALTLAELPEVLPDPALLAVLQGPGDAIGVMALCPQTVTALIEIQTIGRVTGRALAKRRLTRSDATLCAEFVDAFLTELAREGQGVEGLEQFQGYRYVTQIDDARPLGLMMEDRAYRSLEMTLLLGESEAREGKVFVALPQLKAEGRRPDPDHRTAAPAGAAAAAASEPVASRTLAVEARQAPVEVVGVLCRRRMTLRELRSLSPGRLLALPRVSLADARLETRDGQLLAIGKFGEADGCHAIRLRDPEAADEAQPVAGSLAEPRVFPDLPLADLQGPDAFRADPTEAAAIAPIDAGLGAKAG